MFSDLQNRVMREQREKSAFLEWIYAQMENVNAANGQHNAPNIAREGHARVVSSVRTGHCFLGPNGRQHGSEDNN